MNQRQLEVFLAAARHGNITAAANELFLTQPTASYQLRLLEEEFGGPLFERRARGVVLTEAGRSFLPVARRGSRGWTRRRLTYATRAKRTGSATSTFSIVKSSTTGSGASCSEHGRQRIPTL